MKTSVLGVRLTDYQREKLKGFAQEGEKEADVVRRLINDLIEGRILDCSEVIKASKKMSLTPQRLIDEIGKELARE